MPTGGAKGIILLLKLPNMIRNNLYGLLSCSFEVGVLLIVDVGSLLRECPFFKVEHDNVTTLNILKKTNFLSFSHIFVDNIFCRQTYLKWHYSLVISYFCKCYLFYLRSVLCVHVSKFDDCTRFCTISINTFLKKQKKQTNEINKRIFENKTSSVCVKVRLFSMASNERNQVDVSFTPQLSFSGNTFCGTFRLAFIYFLTWISKRLTVAIFQIHFTRKQVDYINFLQTIKISLRILPHVLAVFL